MVSPPAHFKGFSDRHPDRILQAGGEHVDVRYAEVIAPEVAGVLLEEELLVDQGLQQVQRGPVLFHEGVQLRPVIETRPPAQEREEVTDFLLLGGGGHCFARRAC